jgi:hypothetical protein
MQLFRRIALISATCGSPKFYRDDRRQPRFGHKRVFEFQMIV